MGRGVLAIYPYISGKQETPLTGRLFTDEQSSLVKAYRVSSAWGNGMSASQRSFTSTLCAFTTWSVSLMCGSASPRVLRLQAFGSGRSFVSLRYTGFIVVVLSPQCRWHDGCTPSSSLVETVEKGCCSLPPSERQRPNGEKEWMLYKCLRCSLLMSISSTATGKHLGPRRKLRGLRGTTGGAFCRVLIRV